MYACTMTGPWAPVIMYLGKQCENRPTRPLCVGIGSRLAIHAGMQIDGDALHAIQNGRYGNVWPEGGLTIPTGVLVGTVELAGWISQNAAGEVEGEARPGEWSQLMKQLDSPWRHPDSRWHWWVRDPRVLKEPIPCRGMQGLWKVPVEHLAALEAL
jgi:hypothetical protein